MTVSDGDDDDRWRRRWAVRCDDVRGRIIAVPPVNAAPGGFTESKLKFRQT